MAEKWWSCPNPKCMWTPQNRDKQLVICPKCGKECVQRDHHDEIDLLAFIKDLNIQTNSSTESNKTKNQ